MKPHESRPDDEIEAAFDDGGDDELDEGSFVELIATIMDGVQIVPDVFPSEWKEEL